MEMQNLADVPQSGPAMLRVALERVVEASNKGHIKGLYGPLAGYIDRALQDKCDPALNCLEGIEKRFEGDRYAQGFKDAIESMVLALRQGGVDERLLRDAVTTAEDAFGNNVEEDDEGTLYEVTLAGFDGDSDETDDLILWIRSDMTCDELNAQFMANGLQDKILTVIQREIPFAASDFVINSTTGNPAQMAGFSPFKARVLELVGEPKFVVKTRMGASDEAAENVFTDDDVPTRFQTVHKAMLAITGLVIDTMKAVESGNMGQAYSVGDYFIENVETGDRWNVVDDGNDFFTTESISPRPSAPRG